MGKKYEREERKKRRERKKERKTKSSFLFLNILLVVEVYRHRMSNQNWRHLNV